MSVEGGGGGLVIRLAQRAFVNRTGPTGAVEAIVEYSGRELRDAADIARVSEVGAVVYIDVRVVESW